MNRARPKQHYRKIKNGVIIINRGLVKRHRTNNKYAYAQGVLNGLREQNKRLADEYDKLKIKIDSNPRLTIADKIVLDNKLSSLKRQVASNNEREEHINKTFFPENRR